MHPEIATVPATDFVVGMNRVGFGRALIVEASDLLVACGGITKVDAGAVAAFLVVEMRTGGGRSTEDERDDLRCGALTGCRAAPTTAQRKRNELLLLRHKCPAGDIDRFAIRGCRNPNFLALLIDHKCQFGLAPRGWNHAKLDLAHTL